ncbi:MAG TPA: DUF4349 domain-containing protein [Phycisphaerales bacterium]|nr:DUF4349 domain-containing protein [Phycisphaerales bacterium]
MTSERSIGFDPDPQMSIGGAVPLGAGPFGDNTDAYSALGKRTTLLRGQRSTTESADLTDRAVISKCWIDLESADVYATFSKAMLLVSEAQGEYVEGTAITGEGAARRATMTLRVTAARQTAVLQGLRDLAKVKAEQSNNEDVTAQVVDLEARIANERRTEAELLALFDTRKDAPLNEIMQLRDSIARVRDSIERLVAQQQKLSRLVALTTITVNISAPQEAAPPPEPKRSSLGDFFFKRMDESWTHSLEALVDAAAFIVRAVIGGLPFWLAAGLLVVGARALWRRTAARAAMEPAPALK